jgi:predicted acylesterase/phospholipase RssA
MPNGDNTPTFEIGLVMAGAISAGAYTAGVVDFLIEALDTWEASRSLPGYRGPRHRVAIKVMTGASAGGMTSSIAAVALHSRTEPVRDVDAPPPPQANRLFDAWVRRIDITSLLRSEDLQDGKPVASLLDATELARIADDALKTTMLPAPRAYVSDPLPVFLTVANLRGVPYAFDLFGSAAARPYGMLAHADHMRFAVSRSRTAVAGARLLDPAEAPNGNWPQLALAALASGAFPVGLRPRLLEREYGDYRGRFTVDPRWPDPLPQGRYRLLCVDGGLMNNEPLELARSYLADGGRNPRAGSEAHRAVVMIDPFPNTAAFDAGWLPNERLLSVVGNMFGALVDQARFKPEELQLAENPEIYSRFMVAPSRDGVEPAMASAILGGFGGFLSEAYRRHDFQLGRRNCQAFLRWHFCLPEKNPIFATWQSADERAQWHVRDPAGAPLAYTAADPAPMLPIIPLMPEVATEIPAYPAPRPQSVDLPRLSRLIDARMKAVGAALIETDLAPVLGGAVVRWLARMAFDLQIRPKLLAKAQAKVAAELARLI